MKIFNSTGFKIKILKKDILFSFSCDDNVYFVLKNAYGVPCDCVKARWNFLGGWHNTGEDVESDALRVAYRIYMLGEKDPERFAMSGEHYRVSLKREGDRLRFGIIRRKRPLMSGSRAAIPLMLQIVLSLLFSVTMYFLFSDICMDWLSFLSPTWEPVFLKHFIFGAEIAVPIFLVLLLPGKRSVINSLFNSALPIGTFILLGLAKRWTWFAILLPLVLGIVFFLVVKFNTIAEANSDDTSVLREICGELRSTFVILVTVCILCTGIFNIKPYTYKSRDRAEAGISEEELYEQFKEGCLKIENNNFKTLSTQEKLDLLQLFCDYECRVTFGCESAKIYALDIDSEQTLGHYTYPDQTITIDIEHLNDGRTRSIIDTLLHEIRHHWQHQLIEVYVSLEPYLTDEQLNMSPFREAIEFSENFNDYKKLGTDGFEAYYYQAVEIDAREWADQRIGWYDSFIYGDEWLYGDKV